MSVKDDKLQFKLGKIVFGIQVNDKFQIDEIRPYWEYLRKKNHIKKGDYYE